MKPTAYVYFKDMHQEEILTTHLKMRHAYTYIKVSHNRIQLPVLIAKTGSKDWPEKGKTHSCLIILRHVTLASLCNVMKPSLYIKTAVRRFKEFDIK